MAFLEEREEWWPQDRRIFTWIFVTVPSIFFMVWLYISRLFFLYSIQLLFSVAVMFAMLNLNGYMNTDSIFYMPLFNGYFSDSDPFLIQMIPSLIHGLLIYAINQVRKNLQQNSRHFFRFIED